MAASAGPEIERLIALLAKLPGLGPRSARRAALALLKRRDQLLDPLTAALVDAKAKVRACSVCGALDSRDPCAVCSDPQRDQTINFSASAHDDVDLERVDLFIDNMIVPAYTCLLLGANDVSADCPYSATLPVGRTTELGRGSAADSGDRGRRQAARDQP